VSERLDRWLFAPANARAAAWLRIAFALFVPWCFASGGLEPRLPDALASLAPLYAAVFLTPAWWAAVLFACAALLLGVLPRACVALLVVLLLPLCFLSEGRQSRHVVLAALVAFGFVRSDVTRNDAGPLWPMRLIQIQLSLLYAVNAIAKLHPAYLRGDVLVGFSITRPNFRVDLSDGFLHVGPLTLPAALLAVATVATEAWLAAGWWRPETRWITAAIGVGFHVALLGIVEIHMLDAASVFLYLAFLLPFERAQSRAQ
jgi:hypothetical protein